MPKEPQLQFFSKDEKLHVYHVYPIPTTRPKHVQEGDSLWKELMRRWCGHEDATVHVEEQFNVFDIITTEKSEVLDNEDYEPRSAVLPPLFRHLLQASVLERTILRQMHTLHLALTLYGIPLAFSSPNLDRPDSPFSIHDTKNQTHPLTQAVRHIASSLTDLAHLTSTSLTLTLYPGPAGDTTWHGYEKYFTTLEEMDGLWDIVAPLKNLEGMKKIIVRRLGACVRWGRRGSSLFPVGDGMSIVEGNDDILASDW
jgi:hypothetical protein